MSDFIKLTNEELDLKQITDLVNSPDCGSISIFVGNQNLKYFKYLNY